MSQDLPPTADSSLSDGVSQPELTIDPELSSYAELEEVGGSLVELKPYGVESVNIQHKKGPNKCQIVIEDVNELLIKEATLDIPPEVLAKAGESLITVVATEATREVANQVISSIKRQLNLSKSKAKQSSSKENDRLETRVSRGKEYLTHESHEKSIGYDSADEFSQESGTSSGGTSEEMMK